MKSSNERGAGLVGLKAGALVAGVSLAVVPAVYGAPAQQAAPDDARGAADVAGTAAVGVGEGAWRPVLGANPVGSFCYSQDVVTDSAALARAFSGVDRVLCGAGEGAGQGEAPSPDVSSWTISVGGDGVENAYAASIGELAQTGSYQTVLGCTCLGNPADGRATANADVCGVTLDSILERAGLAEGANTITFVSSDGYEVSLPLGYVQQRMSLIVYRVNGAPVSETMGGTNQLWLGSTAARYFSRDVVEIVVSCEDEVPAAPGTPEAGDEYANRPNVGVLGATAGGVQGA